MRGRWFAIFLIFLGCQSDFFPSGLYHYQVERLLSGGSSKVWNQVINSSNCSDSVKLYVEFVSSSTNDSLAFSNLTPNSDCTGFDTTFIGNASASAFDDGLLFSDSLAFTNGDFWIVNSITSQNLSITREVVLEYRF